MNKEGKAKMNSYIVVKKFGWSLATSVLLLILSSPQATADPRETPDPGIFTFTIIAIPNHASYRVGEVKGKGGGKRKAPFGSGGGCPLQRTVNSPFPLNTTLVLRKNFALPAGASNLRVQLSIDNDARVFINGTEIFNDETGMAVTHEDCPLVDEFLLTAPDDLLLEGRNRLRVEATDRGGESYVDLRVLVDIIPPP